MAGKTQAKHGGARKIGRSKTKCEQYRNAHTRERNKIKRVLQSNGYDAALAYAAKTGVKMPKVAVTV